MLQIAYGLEFIAKHKIVHRDLKPDNIFILKKDKYKVYKLGDFGFSVKKELNSDTVGTPLFMSPELVMGIGYSSEVDVWAYGLIFHVLLFNKDYFMEASEKLVKEKVKNVPY